jgi:protein CpxP
MKKVKWLTTTAAVLAFGATLAIASPGEGRGKWGGEGKGRHGRHGGYGPRFAEKLNLTDAQKAQLDQLRASFRESNKALFEASRETMKRYREAEKAGDTATMQSLQPQVDAHRTQMKEIKEAQKAQIRAILTPEQRAQFDAMEAQRFERGKHGGKHRRGQKSIQ